MIITVIANNISVIASDNGLSFKNEGTGQPSILWPMDRYIKNGPRATSVQAVKDALAGQNNMVGYNNFCYLPSADFSEYSSYIIIGSEVFYRR